jgi:hypothetical protein
MPTTETTWPSVFTPLRFAQLVIFFDDSLADKPRLAAIDVPMLQIDDANRKCKLLRLASVGHVPTLQTDANRSQPQPIARPQSLVILVQSHKSLAILAHINCRRVETINRLDLTYNYGFEEHDMWSIVLKILVPVR